MLHLARDRPGASFQVFSSWKKRGHAAITAAQSVRSKGTPEALIRAEMVPALGAVWCEDAANQWSALVTTKTNVGTTKTKEGGKQTGRSRKRSKTPYSCSALVFSPANPPHDLPPRPVMRHRDTVRINITSECASQRHSIRGSRISHSGWRALALMALTLFYWLASGTGTPALLFGGLLCAARQSGSAARCPWPLTGQQAWRWAVRLLLARRCVCATAVDRPGTGATSPSGIGWWLVRTR